MKKNNNEARWLRLAALAALLAVAAGCSNLALPGAPSMSQSAAASGPEAPAATSPEPAAATPPEADPAASAQEAAAEPAASPAPAVPGWAPFKLPGKRSTEYKRVQREGRNAIHARGDRSASMLRRAVSVPPDGLGALQFSWWVPALIPGAALGVRDTDDTPVRIVLAFDGDHSKLPLKERLQFELAETLTGERPPYATLMYVWDTKRALDDVIMSPRTERIRKLVVESGASSLKRWCDYQRDVRADYLRAFGEEPGRLMAVGVMTDSDNTQTQTEAWYGDISFRR